MLRVLVTGVNGFVGKHLVRELKSRGHEVVGLGHEASAHPEIASAITYRQCDLTDAEQVAAIPLDGVNAIINLAGLARAGDSFADPDLYKKVNVEVLTRLGERLLEAKSTTRFIAISTGTAYESHQPMPLTESSKVTTANSPYATSKLMMEDAARKLRSRGLDIVTVRPFNHIGPGQASGFLIPDLFQKLTKAKETGQPARMGNLKTRRDYTDVRDIVKAYTDLTVAETLEFDLYNICTGASHSGQEILDIFLKHMDLTDKIQIEVDQSLIRPNDPKDLYGSYERLREETGWEPEIPLDQTIADFIASQE